LEVRLDETGLWVGGRQGPVPASTAELLRGLRGALAQAPRPEVDGAGVPLAGGLVGYAAYDVGRHFARLPLKGRRASGVPALHYAAPRSILVFDHLTRAIALVHAGPEAERRALRREVVRALHGALPNGAHAGRYSPPAAAYPKEEYLAGVRR